jgi:hypothetical protein
MVLPDSDGVTKGDHVDTLASAETLLRDEFGQAWQHFRHLEAMRGQYLAFAFTITLASFAAAIPLVANIGENTSTVVLLAGVFIQLYCLILASLYFSVRKIRIALAHYRKIIDDIRRYFYDRARDDFDYNTGDLTITGQGFTILGWRIFRLQTTSESILIAFLVISGAAEAVCVGSIFTLTPAWWHVTLVVVAFACVVVVIAAVSRFAWVQRGDEFSSQAHQ